MSQVKNPVATTCWRTIGVWGTSTPRCEKLREVVHCRNCEVYWDAGREVFERTLPEGYLDYWTRILSGVPEARSKDTLSIIYFRIAREWFALPSSHFVEVSPMKPVQRIPHQSGKYIIGLVNVGGSIRLCFSLGNMLGVTDQAETQVKKYGVYQRYLVVNINKEDFVFPVDEVGGVYRYASKELAQVPATVEPERAGLLLGMLEIEGNNVACIDIEKLGLGFTGVVNG